jgi:hypothetical protein
MDPDAPWQGSPKAAPRKAVEAEHHAASRSYVQRDGKTGTVDAKGRARRSRNCRREPGGTVWLISRPAACNPGTANRQSTAWRPSPATTTPSR